MAGDQDNGRFCLIQPAAVLGSVTQREPRTEPGTQLGARRSTAVGRRLRSGETINLTGFTDQAGKDGMLLSLQLFLAGAGSGY